MPASPDKTTRLRALVVDDEPAVRRFLRTSLESRGYQVSEACNGLKAIDIVTQRRPDVILLDLGLPDLDGVEVTRILREWSTIPILILSVRANELDIVAALDAGADDYLAKPFGMNELLARMRAISRRVLQYPQAPVLVSGSLRIDWNHRDVSRGGLRISLTPTEYDLLQTLARQTGKVLTHQELLHKIWGELYRDLHILRVNVSNLRKKIEIDPGRPVHLVTEPGVGYRFVLPEPY